MLEPLFLVGFPQAPAFSSPYLIDRLVQVHRNVKNGQIRSLCPYCEKRRLVETEILGEDSGNAITTSED